MKKVENIKAYYYFDEAGTSQILGHRGVNLIEQGVASKTFIIGYLETKEPRTLSKAIIELHKQISQDEYYSQIPSIKSTKNMFHANKDCAEVREKVFRLLKQSDWSFYCIVARKKLDTFQNQFKLDPTKIYEHLVASLLENRLHLYSDIDCYFSCMGNVVRKQTMENAIKKALNKFQNKWNKKIETNVRVFIQQSKEVPLLQACDYALWTVQRVFEKKDFRYYNFLKEKIAFVYDIFGNYPKIYFTPTNPLEIEKLSL